MPTSATGTSRRAASRRAPTARRSGTSSARRRQRPRPRRSRKRSSAMTKAELVDEVGRQAALPRKHSAVIVDAVFSSIVEALQRGDKIELRGFGSFRIRRRASRPGRNPKTGQGGGGPPDE